jgi:hypothetical protein
MNPLIESKLTGVTGRDTVVFGGLNLTRNRSEGELLDCRNISSRGFPGLSTRLGRKHELHHPGIGSIASIREKLAYAADGDLLIDGIVVYSGLAPGEKQFASIGNRLVIWPDKLVWNYDRRTMSSLDVSVTLPPESGLEFIKHGDEYIGVSIDNSWVVQNNSPLAGFFKVGDTIKIEGAVNNPQNNGYYTILDLTPDPVSGGMLPAVGMNYIYINTNMGFGTNPETGTVTISRSVPDFELICGYQNRLWGTKEFTVYASAIPNNQWSDSFNFDRFLGDEADSWYGEVTSDGAFTGLIGFYGTMLAFKEQKLVRISGTNAQNYFISEIECEGVQKGSSRSLVNLGGILYYLGLNGVMGYSGDLPSNVSRNLGYLELSSGIGGTDGRRLYMSAMRPAGRPMPGLDDTEASRPSTQFYERIRRLYVFEPYFDTWTIEDEADVRGFAFAEERLHALIHEDVWLLGQGTADAPEAEDADGRIGWSVTLCPFDEQTLERRLYIRLVVELELEHDSHARLDVWTESTRDTPSFVGELSGREGRKLREFSIVPARGRVMYLRLSGQGAVSIRGVRRVFVESTERKQGR